MTPRAQLTAVLKALRFHDGCVRDLSNIPANDWRGLLRALDRAHLTLALASRCRNSLPETVRHRLETNLAANRVRYDRLIAAQSLITDALSSNGLDYVVLKGLAQWPWYSDDPALRPQYDIDIYVPAESMDAAVRTVQSLGYSFAGDVLDQGSDHLPVMIRRTGWTWRGDYFDPEMPHSLELHFRFWNASMMRFCTEDFSRFRRRRVERQVGALRFQTLHPVDGLSYSAMHLVRHLLNGDMRLSHVYEIAHFLERSSTADGFWAEWRETALPRTRAMEGIAFRLASDWFHCALHPEAREAIRSLPANIQRWFSFYASAPGWSPSTAAVGSAKNEIWLHFCLLDNAGDRWRIASRRLFPRRRTRVLLDPHIPAAKAGRALRIRRLLFEVSFIARRALHHFGTLAPTILGGLRWYFGSGSPADRKRCSETARP